MVAILSEYRLQAYLRFNRFFIGKCAWGRSWRADSIAAIFLLCWWKSVWYFRVEILRHVLSYRWVLARMEPCLNMPWLRRYHSSKVLPHPPTANGAQLCFIAYSFHSTVTRTTNILPIRRRKKNVDNRGTSCSDGIPSIEGKSSSSFPKFLMFYHVFHV